MNINIRINLIPNRLANRIQEEIRNGEDDRNFCAAASLVVGAAEHIRHPDPGWDVYADPPLSPWSEKWAEDNPTLKAKIVEETKRRMVRRNRPLSCLLGLLPSVKKARHG